MKQKLNLKDIISIRLKITFKILHNKNNSRSGKQNETSSLRAVFCKDRLRVCKIEKSDFPKLCQKEGLDELFLKI